MQKHLRLLSEPLALVAIGLWSGIGVFMLAIEWMTGGIELSGAEVGLSVIGIICFGTAAGARIGPVLWRRPDEARSIVPHRAL